MFGYEGFRNKVTPNLTVLVINLDGASKRYSRIREHLSDYGFKNILRLPAVNGRNALTKYDIPEYDGLPCLSYEDPKAHVTHTACYLSHLKALEYATRAPTEWTLILEDDAFFLKNKKAVMKVISRVMSHNDIGWFTGNTAEAYLVNRKGARQLYDLLNQKSDFTKNYKANYQESCLYDWALKKALKNLNYSHYKNLATQRQDDTSYITDRNDTKKIATKIFETLESFSWL